MAIRTIIDKIVKDPEATVIEVTFTDDSTFKTQKEYRLTNFNLENFKGLLRSQIDSFSQVQDVDKAISVGDFDPTGTALTKEEQGRRDYFKNLSKLRQIERAIEIGVKTNTDKDYTDLQTLIKDSFIDSYIDLF